MEKESFENTHGKKEIPQIELKIREPDGSKGFIIAFQCRTEEECAAYNYVVSAIMKREKLNPFHQLGAEFDGSNKPGLHWWEALFKGDVTRGQIETLLPEMEEHIKKHLEGKGEWGLGLLGKKITGKAESLEEGRERAYEGSIGPSIVFERGIERYEKLLGLPTQEMKGQLVLDIGSGPEEVFSKEAKKKGFKVVSLSPELKYEDIRKSTKGNFFVFLHKGFGKGKWQKRSAGGITQELPFKNETFDTEVSLYGGIHYLPYLKSEYRMAFGEILRTLKHGGKAYLYPVNIRDEHKEDFFKLMQELSPQADFIIDLVEKSFSSTNMYRVVLIKKIADNRGK